MIRIEQILLSKGFKEDCPNRNHHTFYNDKFIVIVWFSGRVESIRIN